MDEGRQAFPQQTASNLFSDVEQKIKDLLLECKNWCTLCVTPPPHAPSCPAVHESTHSSSALCHFRKKKYF